MKSQMMKKLLLCLLALCLLASCAAAEGTLQRDEGKLFADGAFPVEPPSISLFGTNSFDDHMVPKLKKLKEEIDVSKFSLSPAEFKSAYVAMLNRNPGLFYVGNSWSYYTSGGIVTSVLPDYRYKASTIPERIAAFEASVNEVVRYANKASTDVGKILRMSDYLCANYEYDTTYTISSPDQFFLKGKGVCQAYTMVTRAVLDELGITSTTATSTAMNHIWNLVLLDGSWYHLDVTWNDPVSDMPLRACHSNLLLSDEGITDSGHYGWETTVTADNTRYDNYFWKNIDTPLSMKNDTVYYVPSSFTHPNRKIYAFDLTTETASAFQSYKYTASGSYYPTINPVWVTDTHVYYTVRNKLCCVPIGGGTASAVLTLSSDMYIWNIYQSGDTLQLYAHTPGSSGSIYSYELNVDRTVSLGADAVELAVGGKHTFKPTFSPEADFEIPMTWTMTPEDTGVITLSSAGVVKAVSPGAVQVTVTLKEERDDDCFVVVHDDKPLRIPAGTTIIPEEAFAGTAVQEVILPEGVERIEAGAFAGCEQLMLINLPDSLTYIAPDAIPGNTGVALLCGSETGVAAELAAQYAADYSAVAVFLPEE